MDSAKDRNKLKKVARLTINNVTREVITEVEMLFNVFKALVDRPEQMDHLDEAFELLRNRIFDIGGVEIQRFQRYLDVWDVEQKSQDLDWVEYGPRLK